jgi:hypothetical protein
MPVESVTAGDRAPRAGRYLIPGSTPRRAEFIAACAVLVVLVHLLFAQLTLILAIVFQVTTKLTRWRPQWLAAPAVIGAVWALAEGLGRAFAGFTDGPGQIASYLGGVGGHPGRIVHLGTAYAGLGHWLPRQFPVALIVAAAEAALAAWLRWLHTDEWRLPGYRPGLLTYVRRRYLLRFITSGGVVTRDGACIGLDATTGWRVAVSWAEAEGGVLCAGSPGSGTTTTSFQFVHAAIRRRKPVIAVDLDGSQELAGKLTAVCAATQTPLYVFPGPGYYDPLRSGEPARRTSLVMGMVEWSGAAESYRRSCAAYLNDLFAVVDAAPGDPRAAMLDEIVHLLSPAALRARMGHVPGYHPRRHALAERVKVSASLLEADPRITATLAEQLNELRASPLGRWLVPGPGPRVDLGRVVRERAVVLFSAHTQARDRAAATMAGLVAHDVLAVCTELRRIGVPGDGLVWFDHCARLAQATLAELIDRGAAAGLPALLTTTSPDRIKGLADQANVMVLHRLTDHTTAERFAGFTGEKLVPAGGGDLATAVDSQARAKAIAGTWPKSRGQNVSAPPAQEAGQLGAYPGGAYPGGAYLGGQLGPYGLVRRPMVAAQALSRLGNGEHVLIVARPQCRLVTLGLTVPARIPRHPVKPLAPRQAVSAGLAPVVANAVQPGSGPARTGEGPSPMGAGQIGMGPADMGYPGAEQKGRAT